MFDALLYPYQTPAFTSFSITGQSTTIEVGTSISGSKTFTWSTSNFGNINTNTILIKDQTANVILVSASANDGTETITLPSTIVYNVPSSNTWSITATNSKSSNFSTTFSVSWVWNLYYGTSANTILTATQIQALLNSLLTGSASRTYSYAAGGYKYLSFPTTFTSPASFKDASNNLNVAMSDTSDDASYSNVANGINYALVSVTNVNGQTVSYRVYRTKNILGGTINIIVA